MVEVEVELGVRRQDSVVHVDRDDWLCALEGQGCDVVAEKGAV